MDESTSESASTPSRSDLLDQLERLLGSRDPDFDELAQQLEQLQGRVAERNGDQFAQKWFDVYGRPFEMGRLAYERWDELGEKTKQQIVEELRVAEPIGDEMSYLSDPS